MKHKSEIKLLNKPDFHSHANVFWKLGLTQYGLEATFTITDCTRSVNLDFDVESYSKNEALEPSFENGLYKIDTMLDCLEKFKKEYIRHYTKASALKAKKDKD